MRLNKNWQVVVWGHSIEHQSTHTHRWIQHSFAKAFRHLGIDTYSSADIQDPHFDYSNTLFIGEWQEMHNVPIRDDCFYVLHNCDADKWKNLYDTKRAIRLSVYSDDVLKCNFLKKDECIYYDVASQNLSMPWATDLLPDEIEANKPGRIWNKNSNIIHWVGTVGAGDGGNINEISPFIQAATNNGIHFNNCMNIKKNKAIQLIKESYCAPVISGSIQCKTKYIPCRLFKNISYGMFPLVNHERMNSLFDNKLIFNENTHQLFYDAKEKLPQVTLQHMHDLMDIVKEKHTYINRIGHILDFIALINPSLIGDMIL